MTERVAWNTGSGGQPSPNDLIGSVDPVDGTELREGEFIWLCRCGVGYHGPSVTYLHDENHGRCFACGARAQLQQYQLFASGLRPVTQRNQPYRDSPTHPWYQQYATGLVLALAVVLVGVAAFVIALADGNGADSNSPSTTGSTLPERQSTIAVGFDPTSTPRVTRPLATPRPTRTPRPIATARPTRTPRPIATPRPTRTPQPTATPRPTRTPRPIATPRPTQATRPTATPRPTHTPRPASTATPANSLAIGDVIYDRPLTQWPTGENDAGWSIVTDGALELGVWAGADRHWNGSWTSDDSFADVAASVSVRTSRTDVNAAACLVSRHTAFPDRGLQWVGYEICLGTDGSAWAVYKYFRTNGDWEEQTLIDSSVVPQSFDVTRWNTLAVISHENQFWLYVNDVMIGSGPHSGLASGSVGLYVVDLGDAGTDFLFRDLTVKVVE